MFQNSSEYREMETRSEKVLNYVLCFCPRIETLDLVLLVPSHPGLKVLS